MKTYYKSNEIAHIWANLTEQDCKDSRRGRCASSISFEGERFVSYSTTIARHIWHKGRHAVVVDGASFSNTTSKHQYAARRACSHLKVFTINAGAMGQSLPSTPQGLAAHYADAAARAIRQADEKPVDKKDGTYSKNALKRIAAHMSHAATLLESAVAVSEYFGVAKPAACKLLVKRASEFEAARKGVVENAEKLAEAKRKRDQAEAAKRKREYIEDAKHILAIPPESEDAFSLAIYPACLTSVGPKIERDLREWVNRRDAAEEEAWRNGSNKARPIGTLLRVEGDEIVTSRGARVSIEDARKGFTIATSKRNEGWECGLADIRIGEYPLRKIDKDAVTIGCHVIPWTEIDRITASLGWN